MTKEVIEEFALNISSNDIIVYTLTIMGIFIAVYAGMIYIILSGRIKNLAISEVKKEKFRMGANMLVDIGFVYWGDYQTSKKSKFLEHAIRLTERAYSDYGSHLDESNSENELLVCQIKNNLAYYYANRMRLEDGVKARQYAKDILAKSHRFKASKRMEMIDTYKYVQRQFPKSELYVYLEKGGNP